MKKYALFAFFIVLVAMGSAHAQSASMTANIPFDFVVGNATYPAGTYTIRSLNPSGTIITLRSSDMKDNVIVPVCGCASEARPEVAIASALVFKQVEGQNYLWQIWTQGYEVGRQLNLILPQTDIASARDVNEVVVAAAKHL